MADRPARKILISGAGIAGPCLAFWLERHGFEPTIVEQAPALRTGGYIIDFWGAGFDVADRMGIAPQILAKGYTLKELRRVDRNGKRASGFAIDVFDELSGGRYTSVPRSELAAAIVEALDDRVEMIFGDSVTRIEDRGDGLEVQFERGAARRFDLVIGADGLHSQVRRLAFGDQARFEKFLGIKVAAFSVAGYRPRDELIYVVHSEVGQQIGRFAMRDDRTMFLFVFKDASADIPAELSAQKALLREEFADSGWECPRILDALDGADNLYLDRVSQIHMDRWSQGRVALVGDAAACVSLLGGQGSALAMVEAYILAGELKRAGGAHEVAFAAYEERLRSYLEGKQRAAVKFAPFFTPRSRFGIFVGNQVMKLMGVRFVTKRVVGRELADIIELPAY